MTPARARNHPFIAVTLAVSILAMWCSIAKASEAMPLGGLRIKWRFNSEVGPLKGELRLTCTNPVAFSTRLRTNAEGIVTVSATDGECVLESASPFLYQSKVYSWRESVKFAAGRINKLTLSKHNAVVREGENSPSVPVPPVSVFPAAAGGLEPIEATGDVVDPVIVMRVEPNYPNTARRARIEGKVILHAVIDKEGNVNNVTVLSSSNPMFNDSAIEAVKQRKYKPALQNGRPVAIYFTIRIDFRLR